MRHWILASTLVLSTALTADATPRAEGLLTAIGADKMIELMRVEGLEYGAGLADDMFPGRGGDRWEKMVSDIYDVDRMMATFIDGFATSFDEEYFAPVEDFYASEIGKEVVALELATREAFLEEGIEDAARDAIPGFEENRPETFAKVAEFIEINSLIDENVIGALNANFAFMTGLSDGGGFPTDLTQNQILNDVWAQEAEIRQNSTEWLFAYLLMAYSSLPDEDMEQYLELSRSQAGQALTRALFEGFDDMFVEISRDLGIAASQFMAGEEL
ncbi:DUF2059 domain-containing protein [Tropicimonas sp. S265A]|uniref:DUF2059 domain-containing protein n=1 Tax=Tropicimonas sp. S265A TaxID=3415134 RepID=UPI003C7A48D7